MGPILLSFSRRFQFWAPFLHLRSLNPTFWSFSSLLRPITIMLDGPTNYHAWSQNMTVFLKDSKLWRYVTGSIPKSVSKPKSKATAVEDASKTADTVGDYEECLEEWESIQSKILS